MGNSDPHIPTLATPLVQPVGRSKVDHTIFAIYAYCQVHVPLLHLGGVRQWFAGGPFVVYIRALYTLRSVHKNAVYTRSVHKAAIYTP